MNQEKIAYIQSKIEAIGLSVSQKQADQLYRYYEMLIEKNKVMNLTGITEFDEVVRKHFLDSLMIATKVDMSKVGSMIDVGTGAGLPGIPIKILFPHIEVLLLDSLNKRLVFLQEVIEDLELENIDVLHSRAEDAGKGKQRQYYDLCVSRAVANLSSLTELCLPLVKVGGSFVSYKSGEIEEEAQKAQRAVKLLGGKKPQIKKFVLPESDDERSLVIIEKIKDTPKNFPRKAGLPIKKPIMP